MYASTSACMCIIFSFFKHTLTAIPHHLCSGEEEKSLMQVGVEMMMNSKKHDVEEDNLVMDTKLKIIEIIKVCNTA